MFTKRPDKTTTGMINMSNDCFANSTLQSLSALPGLNDYLNNLHNIREKIGPEAPVPELHIGLAHILHRLQKPSKEAKCISVWDFLSIIERMFKSHISRNQHDAQELLQLIIETLDKEYSTLKKYLIDEEIAEKLPPFPFTSLAINEVTCLACHGKSDVNYTPMAVISLPLPQTSNVTLTELIATNQAEIIDGYSCLKCKVGAILQREEKKSTKCKFMKQLREIAATGKINDDIPDKELENYINNYKDGGFDIKSVKSSVQKLDCMVEPPKELAIHLSRSIFSSTRVLRNPCTVEFEDTLKLEIDPNLSQQVRQLEKKKEKEEIVVADYKPSALNDYEKGETSFHEDASASDSTEEDEQDSQPGSSEEEIDNSSSEDVTVQLDSSLSLHKTYKYKLRAVIRHQGSHTMGHYECYKRKPIFYKDPESGLYSPHGYAALLDVKAKEDVEFSEKRKKLSSSVKYPYWRISDTKVTEYKTSKMVKDGKAAYMLFYEREN